MVKPCRLTLKEYKLRSRHFAGTLGLFVLVALTFKENLIYFLEKRFLEFCLKVKICVYSLSLRIQSDQRRI
jgi:hypothetical protein